MIRKQLSNWYWLYLIVINFWDYIPGYFVPNPHWSSQKATNLELLISPMQTMPTVLINISVLVKPHCDTCNWVDSHPCLVSSDEGEENSLFLWQLGQSPTLNMHCMVFPVFLSHTMKIARFYLWFYLNMLIKLVCTVLLLLTIGHLGAIQITMCNNLKLFLCHKNTCGIHGTGRLT